MIPVKLTLKNFLSYGEDVPPLDFEQFHIACLSGSNGQGKSALLDAITWAVWGEGRKSSREKKADNSLLRIGQKDMNVEFLFDIEGNRYRIIRTFSLGNKNSRSGLEFHVLNHKNNQYVSLSAASIKKTQEKIISVLKIDYQTFINSAFILQGRIDEFSRKNARERKDILSEILNLSRYDRLANLAKLHLKKVNHSIIRLEGRLQVVDEELQKSEQYKDKIEKLLYEYKIAKEKIIKSQERITASKEKLNTLVFKKEQFSDLENRLKRIQQEIEHEKKNAFVKNEELKYCEEIISGKEKICQAYKNYQAFSRERNELVGKLQKVRKLESEKVFIEKKIEDKKMDLTIALSNNRSRYTDLQNIVKESEKAKKHILDLENKMKEFVSLENEKEKIREHGMNLKLELEKMKDREKRLEKIMEDEREKLRLLTENPQGTCPLCESQLTSEKKKNIEDNINLEINRLGQEIKRLIIDLKEKNQEKEKLAILWAEIDRKLRAKGKFQEILSSAREKRRQAEQAKDAAKSLAKEIKIIQDSIDKKKYAESEYNEFERIIGIIQNLSYQEERHYWLDKKISALQEASVQYTKLEDSEKKINILRKEIVNLNEKLILKRTDVKAIEQKMKEISGYIRNMPDLKKIINTEEELLKFEQVKSNQLLEEKGVYQGRYKHCLKLIEERKELTKDLKKERKEQGIYEKLIIAFGKNGIQALIIENVLPEIEEEANDILAKLTNHRTQISIESLRDLKSGEPRETLDIKISDELGNRDYELYSGGESFRIDFALRIALSKLLTRRAGAKLRTLVMDEGFGTQDEEGIENLIQAIETISEDFDKIIVITHLESLKTAFPVRIDVSKLPEIGSRYELIKN